MQLKEGTKNWTGLSIDKEHLQDIILWGWATVVRPKCLNVAETLDMTGKDESDGIRKKEGKN